MSLELVLEIIPGWQLHVFAAVFGALWGSFANVVIARWPKEMSVVRPASHCFACETPVRFYDNIPVVSYLLLRGRCRHCKARFSARYAVVELAMALLSVGVMRLVLASDPQTVLIAASMYFFWFGLVWALITAGLIDLDTFLLPDVITLPGIGLGLFFNIFVLRNDWMPPVIGAVGGYAVLSLLFVHGYKALFGHSGMGRGDPKLVAMIGACLGYKGAMFALFAGALQGLFAGALLVFQRRKSGTGPEPPELDYDREDGGDPQRDMRLRKARVPFGPFLALGAIEYLFFGDILLAGYLGLFERLLSAGM